MLICVCGIVVFLRLLFGIGIRALVVLLLLLLLLLRQLTIRRRLGSLGACISLWFLVFCVPLVSLRCTGCLCRTVSLCRSSV